MKKVFVLVSIFLILFAVTLSAIPVSFHDAEQIAKCKLQIENKNDFIIKNFYALQGDDDAVIGYVFQLDPQGFIIVTTDTDIAPILGYSFLNNFEEPGEDEWTLGHHFVTLDLTLRNQAIPHTSDDILSKNNTIWHEYTNNNVDYFLTQAKDRSIYPPTGTTTTGGWIEETWDQSYPWNQYCPLDPQNGGRSVTGCVATAMGMIIDYHRYIGGASFSDADDYVSNYTNPPIYVDNDHATLDFPSWSELNVMLDNLRTFYVTNTPLTSTMEAVVSVASGFSVFMKYSANASGAYCSDVRNALLYKYDFDTASHYYSSHPNFYPQMQQDMMQAKPCQIGITGSGAGHSILVDGYNTGEDTYHLNFGWGSSYNGWYTLPSGMPSGFTSVDNGVLNIQGGIYPYLEIDEMFIAEVSGDGDGEINPGETAQVRIRIKNKQSFSTATGVVAELQCTDPRATITDASGTYNNIPPGSSQLNLVDPYEIEFADGIGMCTIPFTLHVTSNTDYYADLDFEIDVTLNLAGWPVLLTNGVLGSPAVADMDNADNSMELACGDKNGEIHLYNIGGSEVSGFPYNTTNQIYGSVAVSNLDGDDELEIVTASRSNKVIALNPDGSIHFEYPVESNLLCTPVIADLTGDGDKEIIVQTITKKLYVIDETGTIEPNFPVTLPNFMFSGIGVAVEDLDGDGSKEILVPANNGVLYCINATGGTEWSRTLSTSPRCSPTIVEFNSSYYVLIGDANGHLFILNSDGSVQNEFILSGDIQTAPVVINPYNSAQINDLVIIVGTLNGKLYVMDWEGNDLPGFPYDVPNGVQSTPIVADIDGNDIYDIIFGCNDKNLYSIDLTGTPTSQFPIYFDYEIQSSPQIADFDLDGDYDIAVGSNGGMWIIDYKTPSNDGKILCGIFRYDLERTGSVDCSPIVSVGNEPQNYSYYLAQNFPNPVKGSTKISFGLPNTHAQNPQIKVYNLLGQLVSSYDIQNAKPGENIFEWNGRDNAGKGMPNGVYFYRLETDSYQSEIKKLILLK